MSTTSLSVIQPHSSIGRAVATVIALWFIFASLASITNLPMQSPWLLPLLVAIPLLIFALAWISWSKFRVWALELDQRFLITLKLFASAASR